MNLRNLVGMVMLLLWSGSLRAQDSIYSFTLEEAQDYALAHNKQFLNTKEDLLIAAEQIKETRGQGLPQVNATVDYMTNFNYEFELQFGGGASPNPPDIDYTQLDGGDLEVIDFISQMLAPSEPQPIVLNDQANATLQVTQLIFSGQYWVGLQLSKIGRQIAERSIDASELDIRQSVISTYYTILVSEELLNVIGQNYDNLKTILSHTENMFEAGVAEEVDVDQIKVSLSQLENSRNSMERNLLLSYNMMKFQLGMDSDTEVVLEDDLENLLNELEGVNPLAEDLDLRENPTYRMLELQEEAGEKQVEMQKWAYGPTLSGYYSYREKILKSNFDLSPKNAAGLTLQLPIVSGGTRQAKLSKARIELDKINRNKEMLEDQLKLQDKQLSFEYTNALENYLLQKENVGVARRMLKHINNKYQQGIVSSLDLSQANANYLQAESNYVSSVLSLLQAKLNLDKLYNNL